MIITPQTDAPGRVIPILESEFDDFESEAGEFLDGNREEATFIGFRLKQGVYGQRQPDRQMMRIKFPFGAFTADQFDALADVTEQYIPLRKGHVTTRQNIQFHHFKLTDAGPILRRIAESGLSTREACGNTVRNVTGDPYAGVRADEPFDISPYAGAFVRYWVRNPITQLLPRKFKVAFTGSAQDEAITGIHDLGFIPEIRDVDGVPTRGFRMVAGGGLAIMARDAVMLREWVSVDEYLRVSEAVLRIFNAADELRKNRAKARIKFLVHRVGEAAFQQMVDEELQKPWASERPDTNALLFIDDEEAAAPPLPAERAEPAPADRATFERFVATNVRPQRQAGYCTVEVKVPQGDLTPEHFRGIAQIMRTFASGRARTSVNQNIVLRWIPEAHVYLVWSALRELGLHEAGAQEITDVVSCPGTDSCKLGITCSMGLNRAISAKVQTLDIVDPATRRMRINVSGCPNSCGQHHIGSIGFHGAAIKAANTDERQVPAYHIFVGGARANGRIRIGDLLKTRVPAKRAPEVVERFIAHYQAERLGPDEEFNAFAQRVGTKQLEALLTDLALPPEFSLEAMNEFIDWEREGLYVLERGEGECAI
ncbi:MAG: nitrite/sulfite reductase [Chloroflexi bacterium]|nr:nitrite/sulfite reductase [Chloroflexota bacterium]